MADAPSRGGVAGTYLAPAYQVHVGYGYTLAAQGQGSGWFGPSTPMFPVAPPDVAGRQYDYSVGFNLLTQPRTYEPISFRDLRALADGYDLLRLIIETRKDQLARMSWSIKSRDAEASDDNDPRVKAITTFLQRPDGEHNWQDWLRPVLEDLFVLDAPSLYLQRNRAGKLIRLLQVDGATIKPIIDDWGRTPQPYSDGSAMVYPPAYQQVLKGLPAVDYSTRDLIYRPRNRRVHKPYGMSPVEQVTTTVNIALRRQLSTLNYYTEGNIPDMIVQVPKEWTPDQIVTYQKHWDAYFTGDLGRRRRAKFVPGGVGTGGIHETRQVDLKGDFDEWLARVICFAFSISPQAFTKQMNRASADTQKELAEEEGLQPWLLWLKGLFDDIIALELDAPDLEFAWDNDDEVDQAQQLAVLTGYVSKGIMTINESRDQIGLDPLPDPEASQAMIITASGMVPLSSYAQGQQQKQDQLQANAEATARMKADPPNAGSRQDDRSNEKRQAEPKNGPKPVWKYSDDQPRDDRGRFSDGDVKSAILDYTGPAYQQINRELRGVRPASGEHDQTIAALDSHLENSRLPENTILYRGVGSAAVAAWSGQMSKGSVIKDPGFASATTDLGVAKVNKAFASQSRNNIVMEISARKGARASDISAFSDNSSEKETLIARNSSFRIKSWSEKTRTLKVNLL